MLYDAGPILRSHNVRTLEDRVRILRRLVWLGDQAVNPRAPPVGGLKDPRMRQIALAVTRACAARDDRCELDAIYWFVHNPANVRYTGDIVRKDTFSTAYRTLQFGGEDCDGHAVLNAVLAMANGFETKFRITSNTGRTWDHIYTMAAVPKGTMQRWIALDTTLSRGSAGSMPPMASYKDFEVGEVRG